MKYLLAIAIVSILAAVSINAMAQKEYVYCKKGWGNTPIIIFEGTICPWGWSAA